MKNDQLILELKGICDPQGSMRRIKAAKGHARPDLIQKKLKNHRQKS